MHIQVMMITMRFTWALRQSTQTAIQHASVTKQSTFRLASAPLPVLSCKQQTIALSMVHNVNNTLISLDKALLFYPQQQQHIHNLRTFCHCPRLNGGMNPLSSINTPSWSYKHLLDQSIYQQRRACKIINNIGHRLIINLTQYSIFIGSQQTQHVALQ